jgi:hypothetical protein
LIYRPQQPGGIGFGGFGGSGLPVPKDLIGILVALFVTFSLQFFEGAAIIPALLRLTPAVFRGFVWQVVTYPAIGWGASGLWFLLELLILFWHPARHRHRRLRHPVGGGDDPALFRAADQGAVVPVA